MSVFTLTPMPIVHREIGRAFDEFWHDSQRTTSSDEPAAAVDIEEGKDDIVFTLEAPGMTKEDVQITLNQNVISIKGTKKSSTVSDGSKVHRSERQFGSFNRTFKLPMQVKADLIQASYKDGILTITLPKADSVKPREIEIKF